MQLRWLAVGLAVLGSALSGHAYGSDPTADTAAPDPVVVMVWDLSPGCNVRQHSGAPGHRLPCEDVAKYLRDVLHLERGALVRIDVGGDVTPEAVASVSTDLSLNGFKVTDGYRVGFITQPHGSDR